ncbi:MAG: hypothetical protein WAZ97_21115, partial [Pseudolabrys sp.]
GYGAAHHDCDRTEHRAPLKQYPDSTEGFAAGTEAVVRKPPRKEPAGSEARLLPARYGDLIGAMTAAGQLGVPVR